MSTYISTSSVTTVYQTPGSRLLCPPRHLFVAAPAPAMPQDHFHPGVPTQPALPHLPGGSEPFDGVSPQNIRVGNVGELLIGGIIGHKYNAQFADAIGQLKTNGFNMVGIKALGQASLKAGGLSAGITAAVSAFQNIGAAAQGKIAGKEAFSNVASDTVGGLMSGTTAGIGAGAATLALKSFGAGGLVLTIGAAAAGALGGLGGSKLYEATGLRQRVYNAASAFLG